MGETQINIEHASSRQLSSRIYNLSKHWNMGLLLQNRDNTPNPEQAGPWGLQGHRWCTPVVTSTTPSLFAAKSTECYANGRIPAAGLAANLKISPAAVIDPDAALIKTPTAALPA